MSWADELVKVYELAQESSEIKETEKPLPPSHDTVNAQITVTINHDGTIPGSGFAVIIPNDAQEQRTIIPVTEASGGKRSGIHPPLTL